MILVCTVIYAALFIAGAFEGVRSILLPVIRTEFAISNSALGFLIFASFIGFIVSVLINGFAADRFTDKPVLTAGFAIFGIGVMLFLLVRSFPFLLFSYFIARFGMGAVDITASSQGTRLFQKNPTVKINLLHLTFALGATVAPVVGSRLLALGISWQNLFFLCAIPCLLFFVLSLFSSFAPQSARPAAALRRDFKHILADKNIWILGGLLAIAIIGEANWVDWIKNYAIEIGGLDTIRSGNLVGIFYLFLMSSRAVSGFLAERIGALRFFLLYLIGALVVFCSAVLLPFNTILFVSVGWFIGPLFPLVTVLTARAFPNQKASAIGIVFAIGGSLGTFNSFLLGVMHDLFGTQIGFSLLAVGLVVGIPLLFYAKRHLRSAT